MYHVFTIYYTDGKVSHPTCHDLQDQLAYCREGVRGGWIKSYTYTSHEDY